MTDLRRISIRDQEDQIAENVPAPASDQTEPPTTSKPEDDHLGTPAEKDSSTETEAVEEDQLKQDEEEGATA